VHKKHLSVRQSNTCQRFLRSQIILLKGIYNKLRDAGCSLNVSSLSHSCCRRPHKNSMELHCSAISFSSIVRAFRFAKAGYKTDTFRLVRYGLANFASNTYDSHCQKSSRYSFLIQSHRYPIHELRLNQLLWFRYLLAADNSWI